MGLISRLSQAGDKSTLASFRPTTIQILDFINQVFSSDFHCVLARALYYETEFSLLRSFSSRSGYGFRSARGVSATPSSPLWSTTTLCSRTRPVDGWQPCEEQYVKIYSVNRVYLKNRFPLIYPNEALENPPEFFGFSLNQKVRANLFLRYTLVSNSKWRICKIRYKAVSLNGLKGPRRFRWEGP